MLDIKIIRENPKFVENDLKKRGDEERLKIFKTLIEDDKKYREIEYLLEKYNTKIDMKKYIEDKYMDGTA